MFLFLYSRLKNPLFIIQKLFNLREANMEGGDMIGQKMKTFNFVKLLGKGAWAEVYLAVDDRNKSQVAIKVIGKRLIKQNPKLQELIKTQIKVLKSCKNENVIKYIDSFQSERSVFICTEFCNGGDLEQYLEKKKTLSEDKAVVFLKQIIHGFQGLHQVRAMHRDFKLANILVHNGVCKIADLGFAKVLQKKGLTDTVLGTSLTMAPQVLSQQSYGIQADIWSLGVVFYQMLFGKYPYIGVNDMDILKKIKKGRPDYSGVNLTDQCKQFIDKCLTVDPKKRISWRQIYDHSMIKNNSGILCEGSIQTSKINIKKAQKFYSKNDHNQQNIEDSADHDFGDGVQMRNSLNAQQLLKQAQKTKEIELTIGQYEKAYFSRRNSIMFMFKYIVPHIGSLQKIKATHEVSMFIMSKKAYIEMKQMYADVKNKKNFLKIDKYWEEFISSSTYHEIQKQILSDVQTIQTQCLNFKQDIAVCNAEVKAQYDIENIKNKNFKNFFKETVYGYWYLLAEGGLANSKGKQKQELIRVLSALFYLKQYQNPRISQFDSIMRSLDYNKAEKDTLERIQQQYK